MEEAAPENKLTLDSLAARFLLLKTTFDFFYSLAPCMIQTLKLKPLVEGLVPNWNIFREVEKQNLDRNLQINLSLKLRLFPLPPPLLSLHLLLPSLTLPLPLLTATPDSARATLPPPTPLLNRRQEDEDLDDDLLLYLINVNHTIQLINLSVMYVYECFVKNLVIVHQELEDTVSSPLLPKNSLCARLEKGLKWYLIWNLYSSTLAWKIPWMEEPGGLQSMGSLGVGHDWSDLA